MGAETSYKCRGVCKWQNLGDCEGGGHLRCAQGRKVTIGSLLLDESRSKCSEITEFRAANEFKNAHQHQNRGLGVTKAQYIEVTMDYMENGGIFFTRNDKLFDTVAKVLQDDGSRIVSR